MDDRKSAPPKARRFVRGAIEILLLVALVVGIRAYQRRDAITGPAPSFEAEALVGERVALEEYGGGPVILHFWASWCGVCRAMEGNVRSGSVAGVPIVRIATRSGTVADVRAYLARQGESVDGRAMRQVLLDEDGAIAQRYGVAAFPTTFWIGGDGQIRHVEVGYTTRLGLAARAMLVGGD